MAGTKPSCNDVSIRGIVLAAGQSTRFGHDTTKQLLPFRGEPLVRRAVKAMVASRVTETVVVTGHQQDQVREALAGLDVLPIHNPAFRRGQSTSVRTGLRGLGPETAAVVVSPCDQPWLDAAVIDALIETFLLTRPPAVVPRFGEQRGAPTLIARTLFPSLEALEGDQGARGLLANLGDAVAHVQLSSDRPLRDIDTDQDWAALDRYS